MHDIKVLRQSFEQNSRLEEKSENTILAYKSDIEEFTEFIQKDITELDKDDIENFIRQLKRKGLSIKTINRKLVSVRQFINFLNKQEDLGINIKVTIKQAKFQKQEYLEDMLDLNDFNRIVRAAERECDLRALAIFYTLFLTGVRVSELLQFEIADVDAKIITVKGKGQKYRDIFMPKKAKKYLHDYLNVRANKGDYLFTGRRGPLTRQTINSIIKKYAGQAKVKLDKSHAHNFRHLFCVYLLEQGLKIDEVADLAGHSDINITRIYTRKTKKQLLSIINKLGEKE